MNHEHERLAIVTGTSSGIGAAVAEALLREGWSVVGLSRRRAGFGDPRYRHLQVDLSDLARLREVADGELAPAIREGKWRRIGLVNNAGAVGSGRPLEESDPQHLASVFAVNAVAPIFLMGFVVRVAPSTTRIRIVNVSTGAAVRAIPGLGDYGASKAALRLASTTFAAELTSDERPGGPRRNAAVLSYFPGVVDTAMQNSARSPGRPWYRRFADLLARGELLPPEAPAREIVEFLSGDGGEPFVERRIGES
jgi:benzil reductase ((S)-benzoin forming)